MDDKSSPAWMVKRSSLGRKHQRRGAGVDSHGQDEPDGCVMAVADKLGAQVLQGEGGDAVGGHAEHTTLSCRRDGQGASVKRVGENPKSGILKVARVARVEFVNAPVLERLGQAYIVDAAASEISLGRLSPDGVHR